MKTVYELWREVLPDAAMSVPFDLESAAKVVFRVGSHSHGTHIPPEDERGVDDTDLMVICVPPPEYKLGLKVWEHAEFKHGKWDVVFYDWQKWLRMLHKSNPNVLGTLWLDDEDVYSEHGWIGFWPYLDLKHARDRLLSQEMYPSFIGYARAQLHKMTHHAHQGYMGDKRKRLVERFGYDVKNAAHLIRLLRMACGAFETGRLIVRRPDAAEIIAIKRGEFSLEMIQGMAEALFQRAEGALAATKLPRYPDDLLIQRLMVEGYRDAWEWSDQ